MRMTSFKGALKVSVGLGAAAWVPWAETRSKTTNESNSAIFFMTFRLPALGHVAGDPKATPGLPLFFDASENVFAYEFLNVHYRLGFRDCPVGGKRFFRAARRELDVLVTN